MRHRYLSLLCLLQPVSSMPAQTTLGVTPRNARLESQGRQEAKLAGCSYLLVPTIKHQRKRGGGLLGRVAGGAAEQGAWSVAAGMGS